MRVTRASFLALVAAGLATPQRAFGDIRDDLRLLGFVLTVEYVQSALYREGLQAVPDLTPDARRLVGELRAQEVEHVDALRATLREAGGREDERVATAFAASLGSEVAFLKLANTIEDTVVSANCRTLMSSRMSPIARGAASPAATRPRNDARVTRRSLTSRTAAGAGARRAWSSARRTRRRAARPRGPRRPARSPARRAG